MPLTCLLPQYAQIPRLVIAIVHCALFIIHYSLLDSQSVRAKMVTGRLAEVVISRTTSCFAFKPT